MALCTIDQVKEYLNLKASDQDNDALLERLIASTSRRIAGWCGRTLESTTATAKLHGNGSATIWPGSFPITAVSSVSVDGVAVTAFTFDDYSITLDDDTFTKGHANVSVTYTAGYTTIPDDLQEAAIAIVALAFKERDHLGQASKALQTGTTTFIADLPPDVREILWSYRRVTP